MQDFLSNPTVRLMIFLQFLCNFAMTGIGPILPLYIRGMMGGDAKAVATIVGIIIFLAGGSSAMASLHVDRLTARHPMHKISSVHRHLWSIVYPSVHDAQCMGTGSFFRH